MLSAIPCRVWRRISKALRSAAGAFDLPSILVGVGVVGILTAGVLAAVFGVIPFAQDKGASQDLSSVTTAQGVAKVKDGQYLPMRRLNSAGYMSTAGSLAAATDPTGSCFVAVSKSGSGQMFLSTDKTPTAVALASAPDTGCVSTATVADLAVKAGGPAPAPVMTTVWNTGLQTDNVTDPPCTTITMPLTGTIDATVDWGDGSPAEHVTSPLPSHAFTGAPGIKTITINGKFTGWVGQNWDTWSSDCLTDVTEWGDTGTTDVVAGFYDAENLASVVHIPRAAKDWQYLFTYTKMNSDVSSWDTSGVTDMTGMFGDATLFNQPVDNWDTSSVTRMGFMFSDATSFNQPVNDWDTSKVTDMSGLFYKAGAFNQPLDRWNTSSVTDMGSMFVNAGAFNQPLAKWNTSSVADMGYMFYQALVFNQDLSGWKTGNVVRADAFSEGSALTAGNLPVGSVSFR